MFQFLKDFFFAVAFIWLFFYLLNKCEKSKRKPWKPKIGSTYTLLHCDGNPFEIDTFKVIDFKSNFVKYEMNDTVLVRDLYFFNDDCNLPKKIK